MAISTFKKGNSCNKTLKHLSLAYLYRIYQNQALKVGYLTPNQHCQSCPMAFDSLEMISQCVWPAHIALHNQIPIYFSITAMYIYYAPPIVRFSVFPSWIFELFSLKIAMASNYPPSQILSFKNYFFKWKIIVLQCRVSFCCITM